MKSSIKTKSTFFLAMLLLFTVSILSYTVLNGIKENQKKAYESNLLQQGKVANLYVNQAYAAESSFKTEVFISGKGQELARQLGLLSGMHVIIYDMTGTEVGNSFPLGEKNNINDTMEYSLKGNIAYQTIGETIDYLSPLNIANEQIGIVQFKYSLKEDNIFYRNILWLFVGIGSVIFFLSFFIGNSYFNRLVKDILKLKNAVERIKLGIYEEIPSLKRKDELMQLNQDIYFMSNQIKTNIKSMELEQRNLRLAVDKLKMLEQQQKYFIGNITHEFKTPLTVIKAYIDLMGMYTDDPQLIEEAKDKISKETQRLYEMVEKVLNLSALEKYDFESQAEKLDLKQLLEYICKQMEGKVRKFELSLYLNIQNAMIYADRESITQIFINLLDNAIKYNKPKGEIYVNSYIKDKKIYIEVKDTGIGIPNEAKEKLFEPFYRVDKDRSRETGGTGLGLALVKKLVGMQQGTIEIKDNQAGGTTFIIMFPMLS